ncbi:hypothetical protein F383_24501 [Gossypium arboreum]|uniref:Uncharacterized protein n=1 Tax=Gossypium arboreum TaxID=29729 RepID=A0A0B0NWZ7_GOSAR|nr:hypothetical protein F383_24501 [Gossypium arboreum]
MPTSRQKWPFLNWTQLGLGRDTPHVLYPCELCFDSARLTRPCGLLV